MNKITILKIDFSFMGTTDFIYPVVIQNGEATILVDCGYVGSLPLIEQSLKDNNIDPNDLTHLVITHHDHDHMGAAFDIKKKYPKIKIIVSAKESPFVSGSETSVRLLQAENMQKYLPKEKKAFGEKFCAVLRSVKPVNVDIEVNDGDVILGCEILETPGHTPGHLSLLLQKENTLIAGDAAAVAYGELVIANPQFTLDLDNAQKSLEKIKANKVTNVICYHGGQFFGD